MNTEHHDHPEGYWFAIGVIGATFAYIALITALIYLLLS